MMAHLLSKVPWHPVEHEAIVIPPRPESTGYERPPRDWTNTVPDYAQALIDEQAASGS